MDNPTLKDYVKQVIADFIEAEDQEVPSVRIIDFDIGVTYDKAKNILVDQDSTNRIKFKMEVKRS